MLPIGQLEIEEGDQIDLNLMQARPSLYTLRLKLTVTLARREHWRTSV